jgi:hypothetical protein
MNTTLKLRCCKCDVKWHHEVLFIMYKQPVFYRAILKKNMFVPHIWPSISPMGW